MREVPCTSENFAKKLEPILHRVNDPILIIDAQTIIRYVNPAFSESIGMVWDCDTVCGMPFQDLLGINEGSPELIGFLNGSHTEDHILEGQCSLSVGESVDIPVAFQVSRILDHENDSFGFLIRVQRNHDLATSDPAPAPFSNENPFPVLRIDITGKLLYANHGSWLLLSHWNTQVGRQIPQEWVDICNLALESGENQETEIQIGFMTLVLTFVPDIGLAAVNIFGVDITSYKQVEQRLRLDSQVFENASEAIMITDTDERILDVNNAFQLITGYSKEEILGENISRFRSERQNQDFLDTMTKIIQERGSWQGEFWGRRKNGEVYPSWLSVSAVTDLNGTVIRYICLFSDISAIKQSEEQLYHLAHYDALTGLPNRRYFLDHLEYDLERARREKTQVAIMFLDLDGFKLINDNLGHAAGDYFLQVTAERLRECVRESDTVARMGGDEFTIVLPNLVYPENAVLVAQKILKQLALPIRIDETDLYTSTSIGIAVYPDDALHGEALIRSADTALYHAKEQGKNGYLFFSQAMNDIVVQRLTFMTRMRRALENHDFILHYQPQFDPKQGRITGMEALVRWNDPALGMIYPDEFIHLAEENGMIQELGLQVLRMACTQGKQWMDEKRTIVPISVNISGRQVRQPDFVEQIVAIVDEIGFPAKYLEFELTESFLIEDFATTVVKLEKLRELGFALAIDDFGTKYSSLSYLQRLPVNRIKIDRSFIKDLPLDNSSVKIVTAIIAMGIGLELEIVAEGVETGEQLQFLRDRGIDCIQGHYFRQAIRPEEIEILLALTDE